MHPELHERRRSLNIERFAAAREWELAPKLATYENESPVQSSLFSLVTRSILIGVAALAVFIGLVLPLVYGVLPGWESVTGVGAVLAICAIAWAVDSREV